MPYKNINEFLNAYINQYPEFKDMDRDILYASLYRQYPSIATDIISNPEPRIKSTKQLVAYIRDRYPQLDEQFKTDEELGNYFVNTYPQLGKVWNFKQLTSSEEPKPVDAYDSEDSFVDMYVKQYPEFQKYDRNILYASLVRKYPEIQSRIKRGGRPDITTTRQLVSYLRDRYPEIDSKYPTNEELIPFLKQEFKEISDVWNFDNLVKKSDQDDDIGDTNNVGMKIVSDQILGKETVSPTKQRIIRDLTDESIPFRERFPHWVGPEPKVPLSQLGAYGQLYIDIMDKIQKGGKTGFLEALSGDELFRTRVFDLLPFVRGVANEIIDSKNLDVVRYLKVGRLDKVSDEDLARLNSALLANERMSNLSAGGYVGSIAADSIPFAAELWLFKKLPIGSRALAGAETVGNIVKNSVSRFLLKSLGSNAAKTMASEAQSLAGAVSRTVSDLALNTLRDKSLLAAATIAGKISEYGFKGLASSIPGQVLTLGATTMTGEPAFAGQSQENLYRLLSGQNEVNWFSGALHSLIVDSIERGTEFMGADLMRLVTKPIGIAAEKTGLKNLYMKAGEAVRNRINKGLYDISVNLSKKAGNTITPDNVAKSVPINYVNKVISNVIGAANTISEYLVNRGWTADRAFEFLKNVEYHGPIEEFLEERAADFLHGLFGTQGDSAGLANALKNMSMSMDQFKGEILAFTLPMAVVKGGRALEGYAHNQLNRSFGTVLKDIKATTNVEWEIKPIIDESGKTKYVTQPKRVIKPEENKALIDRVVKSIEFINSSEIEENSFLSKLVSHAIDLVTLPYTFDFKRFTYGTLDRMLEANGIKHINSLYNQIKTVVKESTNDEEAAKQVANTYLSDVLTKMRGQIVLDDQQVQAIESAIGMPISDLIVSRPGEVAIIAKASAINKLNDELKSILKKAGVTGIIIDAKNYNVDRDIGFKFTEDLESLRQKLNNIESPENLAWAMINADKVINMLGGSVFMPQTLSNLKKFFQPLRTIINLIAQPTPSKYNVIKGAKFTDNKGDTFTVDSVKGDSVVLVNDKDKRTISIDQMAKENYKFDPSSVKFINTHVFVSPKVFIEGTEKELIDNVPAIRNYGKTGLKDVLIKTGRTTRDGDPIYRVRVGARWQSVNDGVAVFHDMTAGPRHLVEDLLEAHMDLPDAVINDFKSWISSIPSDNDLYKTPLVSLLRSNLQSRNFKDMAREYIGKIIQYKYLGYDKSYGYLVGDDMPMGDSIDELLSEIPRNLDTAFEGIAKSVFGEFIDNFKNPFITIELPAEPDLSARTASETKKQIVQPTLTKSREKQQVPRSEKIEIKSAQQQERPQVQRQQQAVIKKEQATARKIPTPEEIKTPEVDLLESAIKQFPEVEEEMLSKQNLDAIDKFLESPEGEKFLRQSENVLDKLVQQIQGKSDKQTTEKAEQKQEEKVTKEKSAESISEKEITRILDNAIEFCVEQASDFYKDKAENDTIKEFINGLLPSKSKKSKNFKTELKDNIVKSINYLLSRTSERPFSGVEKLDVTQIRSKLIFMLNYLNSVIDYSDEITLKSSSEDVVFFSSTLDALSNVFEEIKTNVLNALQSGTITKNKQPLSDDVIETIDTAWPETIEPDGDELPVAQGTYVNKFNDYYLKVKSILQKALGDNLDVDGLVKSFNLSTIHTREMPRSEQNNKPLPKEPTKEGASLVADNKINEFSVYVSYLQNKYPDATDDDIFDKLKFVFGLSTNTIDDYKEYLKQMRNAAHVKKTGKAETQIINESWAKQLDDIATKLNISLDEPGKESVADDEDISIFDSAHLTKTEYQGFAKAFYNILKLELGDKAYADKLITNVFTNQYKTNSLAATLLSVYQKMEQLLASPGVTDEQLFDLWNSSFGKWANDEQLRAILGDPHTDLVGQLVAKSTTDMQSIGKNDFATIKSVLKLMPLESVRSVLTHYMSYLFIPNVSASNEGGFVFVHNNFGENRINVEKAIKAAMLTSFGNTVKSPKSFIEWYRNTIRQVTSNKIANPDFIRKNKYNFRSKTEYKNTVKYIAKIYSILTGIPEQIMLRASGNSNQKDINLDAFVSLHSAAQTVFNIFNINSAISYVPKNLQDSVRRFLEAAIDKNVDAPFDKNPQLYDDFIKIIDFLVNGVSHRAGFGAESFANRLMYQIDPKDFGTFEAVSRIGAAGSDSMYMNHLMFASNGLIRLLAMLQKSSDKDINLNNIRIIRLGEYIDNTGKAISLSDTSQEIKQKAKQLFEQHTGYLSVMIPRGDKRSTFLIVYTGEKINDLLNGKSLGEVLKEQPKLKEIREKIKKLMLEAATGDVKEWKTYDKVSKRFVNAYSSGVHMNPTLAPYVAIVPYNDDDGTGKPLNPGSGIIVSDYSSKMMKELNGGREKRMVHKVIMNVNVRNKNTTIKLAIADEADAAKSIPTSHAAQIKKWIEANKLNIPENIPFIVVSSDTIKSPNTEDYINDLNAKGTELKFLRVPVLNIIRNANLDNSDIIQNVRTPVQIQARIIGYADAEESSELFNQLQAKTLYGLSEHIKDLKISGDGPIYDLLKYMVDVGATPLDLPFVIDAFDSRISRLQFESAKNPRIAGVRVTLVPAGQDNELVDFGSPTKAAIVPLYVRGLHPINFSKEFKIYDKETPEKAIERVKNIIRNKYIVKGLRLDLLNIPAKDIDKSKLLSIRLSDFDNDAFRISKDSKKVVVLGTRVVLCKTPATSFNQGYVYARLGKRLTRANSGKLYLHDKYVRTITNSDYDGDYNTVLIDAYNNFHPKNPFALTPDTIPHRTFFDSIKKWVSNMTEEEYNYALRADRIYDTTEPNIPDDLRKARGELKQIIDEYLESNKRWVIGDQIDDKLLDKANRVLMLSATNRNITIANFRRITTSLFKHPETSLQIQVSDERNTDRQTLSKEMKQTLKNTLDTIDTNTIKKLDDIELNKQAEFYKNLILTNNGFTFAEGLKLSRFKDLMDKDPLLIEKYKTSDRLISTVFSNIIQLQIDDRTGVAEALNLTPQTASIVAVLAFLGPPVSSLHEAEKRFIDIIKYTTNPIIKTASDYLVTRNLLRFGVVRSTKVYDPTNQRAQPIVIKPKINENLIQPPITSNVKNNLSIITNFEHGTGEIVVEIANKHGYELMGACVQSNVPLSMAEILKKPSVTVCSKNEYIKAIRENVDSADLLIAFAWDNDSIKSKYGVTEKAPFDNSSTIRAVGYAKNQKALFQKTVVNDKLGIDEYEIPTVVIKTFDQKAIVEKIKEAIAKTRARNISILGPDGKNVPDELKELMRSVLNNALSEKSIVEAHKRYNDNEVINLQARVKRQFQQAQYNHNRDVLNALISFAKTDSEKIRIKRMYNDFINFVNSVDNRLFRIESIYANKLKHVSPITAGIKTALLTIMKNSQTMPLWSHPVYNDYENRALYIIFHLTGSSAFKPEVIDKNIDIINKAAQFSWVAPGTITGTHAYIKQQINMLQKNADYFATISGVSFKQFYTANIALLRSMNVSLAVAGLGDNQFSPETYWNLVSIKTADDIAKLSDTVTSILANIKQTISNQNIMEQVLGNEKIVSASDVETARYILNNLFIKENAPTQKSFVEEEETPPFEFGGAPFSIATRIRSTIKALPLIQNLAYSNPIAIEKLWNVIRVIYPAIKMENKPSIDQLLRGLLTHSILAYGFSAPQTGNYITLLPKETLGYIPKLTKFLMEKLNSDVFKNSSPADAANELAKMVGPFLSKYINNSITYDNDQGAIPSPILYAKSLNVSSQYDIYDYIGDEYGYLNDLDNEFSGFSLISSLKAPILSSMLLVSSGITVPKNIKPEKLAAAPIEKMANIISESPQQKLIDIEKGVYDQNDINITAKVANSAKKQVLLNAAESIKQNEGYYKTNAVYMDGPVPAFPGGIRITLDRWQWMSKIFTNKTYDEVRKKGFPLTEAQKEAVFNKWLDVLYHRKILPTMPEFESLPLQVQIPIVELYHWGVFPDLYPKALAAFNAKKYVDFFREMEDFYKYYEPKPTDDAETKKIKLAMIERMKTLMRPLEDEYRSRTLSQLKREYLGGFSLMHPEHKPYHRALSAFAYKKAHALFSKKFDIYTKMKSINEEHRDLADDLNDAKNDKDLEATINQAWTLHKKHGLFDADVLKMFTELAKAEAAQYRRMHRPIQLKLPLTYTLERTNDNVDTTQDATSLVGISRSIKDLNEIFPEVGKTKLHAILQQAFKEAQAIKDAEIKRYDRIATLFGYGEMLNGKLYDMRHVPIIWRRKVKDQLTDEEYDMVNQFFYVMGAIIEHHERKNPLNSLAKSVINKYRKGMSIAAIAKYIDKHYADQIIIPWGRLRIEGTTKLYEKYSDFLERWNNSTAKAKLLQARSDYQDFQIISNSPAYLAVEDILFYDKLKNKYEGLLFNPVSYYLPHKGLGIGYMDLQSKQAKKAIFDQLKAMDRSSKIITDTLLSEPNYTTKFNEHIPVTPDQINLINKLLKQRDYNQEIIDEIIRNLTDVFEANAYIRSILIQDLIKLAAYTMEKGNQKGLFDNPDVVKQMNTVYRITKQLNAHPEREFGTRIMARRLLRTSFEDAALDIVEKYGTGINFIGILPNNLNALELRYDYAKNIMASITNRLALRYMFETPDIDGTPMLMPVLDKMWLEAVANDKDAILPIRKEDIERFTSKFGYFHGVQKKANESVFTYYNRIIEKMVELSEKNGLKYIKIKSKNAAIPEYYVKKGSANILRHLVQDILSANILSHDPYKLGMYATQLSKQMAVGWSAFFPVSLLESLIGGLAWTTNFLQHPIENFKYVAQVYKALAEFKPTSQRTEDIISMLAEAGIQLGGEAALDEYLGVVDELIQKAYAKAELRWDKETASKIKTGLRIITGRALSDRYFGRSGLYPGWFNALKIWAAREIAREAMGQDGLNWDMAPRELKMEYLKKVADVVNDAMGGQFWQRYAWATPRVRQLLNLIVFAPNWTISAANVGGIGILTGRYAGNAPSTFNMRYILLNFLAMNLIVLKLLPQALQAAIYVIAGNPDDKDTPWMFENEVSKRNYVDITPLVRLSPFYTGAPTGERREYVRWGKQYYEVYEGWLKDIPTTFLRKLSNPVKYIYELITGNSPGSEFALEFKNKGLVGWLVAEKTPEDNLLQQFLNSRTGYGIQKIIPMSLVTGIKNPEAFVAGLFAPVSKGESLTVGISKLRDIFYTYANDNEYGRYKKNPRARDILRNVGSQILLALDKNGYDAESALGTAKSAILHPLYLQFINAMEKQDTERMKVLANQILRVGGSYKGLLTSYNRSTKLFSRNKQEDLEYFKKYVKPYFE